MSSEVAPKPISASCKLCTIQLERLCYQRAWWFRPARETFAMGIRAFALAYRVDPADYAARSPLCHQCIRFQKNVLKARSGVFEWMDGYLNPLFNKMRDSLLTPEEIAAARQRAQQLGSPEFQEA